jgi:hypothetical protein
MFAGCMPAWRNSSLRMPWRSQEVFYSPVEVWVGQALLAESGMMYGARCDCEGPPLLACHEGQMCCYLPRGHRSLFLSAMHVALLICSSVTKGL